MGRFRATVGDEGDAGNVQVLDEQSDPGPEPWQDSWWRGLSAIVPRRDRQPEGRGDERKESNNNGRRSSDSPDVYFLGFRTRNYDNEPDSDDGTVDLTDGEQNFATAPVNLAGFWAVGGKERRRREVSANTVALYQPNRQGGAGDHAFQSDPPMYEAQLYGHSHSPELHNDPPAPRRRTCLRSLVGKAMYFLAAPILAYLCTRAPPPPSSRVLPGEAPIVHDTWGGYLLFSGHRFVSVFESTSKETWYAMSGLASNVYYDVADLSEKLAQQWKYNDSPCVLVVPSHDPTKSLSTEELLRQGIAGQDRAVKVISRALDAWEVPLANDEGIVSPLAGCHRDHHTCGKPLVLFITGPLGVGKAETARIVSQMVYSHCELDTENAGSGAAGDGVLDLNGQDFSSATERVDNEKVSEEAEASVSPEQRDGELQFREAILDHIRGRRGAGAVIVLRHFELLSTSVVRDFIRMIGKPGLSRSYEDNGGVRWDNVLFILTSDLGSDIIFKSIRSYEGTALIPQKDLEISIRNELDLNFGANARLGNVVNAVAVLMPLGLPELEKIMRRKINHLSEQHAGQLWKRLDVTDAALHYFVGPEQVAYTDMKRRDSDVSILTFSNRGAHTLDDGVLMQTLKGFMRRRLDHQPDRVAVFHYDTDTQEAMIGWCPNRVSLTGSLGWEDCKEVWRDSVV